MKAKVTKVRPAVGRFADANVIEFKVGNETFSVVIEPGQDVKQRMSEIVAETRRMRRQVVSAAKELQELKKLEGQEIDLPDEAKLRF